MNLNELANEVLTDVDGVDAATVKKILKATRKRITARVDAMDDLSPLEKAIKVAAVLDRIGEMD